MVKWWQRIREARHRALIEDAMKHMHASEWRGCPATQDSLAGALRLSPRKAVKLCQGMQSRGLARFAGGSLRFTPAGEHLALQVIRAHRLWERYLADEARMPLAEIHAVADRREHKRSAEALEVLEAAMGYPASDPHGDPIPTAEGLLLRPETVPLSEWPPGPSATIVHLEDEPKAVFAQIAAEGLAPGQRLEVIESSDQRITFSIDRTTHVLAPVVAANIFVGEAAPAPLEAPRPDLASLEPGLTATVETLDESLQGYTRRRLLDLGLTRGAAVTAEYRSFLGDPIAYRVRGSLVALRREQAEHVLIRPGTGKEADDG